MDYSTANEKLFERLKTEDCRSEIIELNMPLVRHICETRFANWNLRTYTMEDLYQEGYIALIESIDTYDSAKGKFSTYLSDCVYYKVYKAIFDKAYMVYVPNSAVNECLRYKRGENYNCSYETLTKALCALKVPIYLNTSVKRTDSEDIEVMEILESDENIEETYISNAVRELIDSCLGTLTDREQYILTLRYGLDNRPPLTLVEIGEILNISSARVRQIECKALRKLRFSTHNIKERWALKSYYYNF